MEIWYKANLTSCTILKVYAEDDTEQFVKIMNSAGKVRREKKLGKLTGYFETPINARNWILDQIWKDETMWPNFVKAANIDIENVKYQG